MNPDIKWLDNPEVFRVNQIDAHSDHAYFADYEALNAKDESLKQSLNGEWDFCFSINAMERPETFFEEEYDRSGFDKIMVPGHIEMAGYDKIRYINTMIHGKVKNIEEVLTALRMPVMVLVCSAKQIIIR